MQDNAIYKQLREKLLNAEVQAPDFDALLGKDALDDAALRTALSSKLSNHSAPAPDFEALFSSNLLGAIPSEKGPLRSSKKWSAWWSMASVAAACIAVAFLLQNPFNNETGGSSIYTLEQHREKLPKTNNATSKIGSILNPIHTTIDKLNSSKLLTDAMLTSKKQVSKEIQTETILEIAGKDETNNLCLIDSTAKINPSSSKKGLSIVQKEVLNDYELNQLLKKKYKKNRITLGAGINGSNRILSIVNSRDNSGFTLNGVTNKSNGGYEKLEGADETILRSTTISPNEWNTVENLDPSMLLGFKTNYLLPVNIGLTVSIPMFGNVNFITGIQYSYIANHIKGNTFLLKQELHYLGIPAKFSMNFINNNKFIVYALAGATIEKGLTGVQTSEVKGDETWQGTQDIKGLAFSLNGSFGASYELKKNILLYLEPGVSWYAPTDQPICIRTEEPFQFNVSVGLRYRFQ